MSSEKVEIVDSKQNMKQKPKLRFPGFIGDWENKELSPFLQEYSKKVSVGTELPIYSSTRTGLMPQKNYYAGRELINNSEYRVVPESFFVYRHMSDDGLFMFNINRTGVKIAVSKEYPVFTTKNLYADFLFYKLNYDVDFKKYALMQKKGGTRTRLYFKTLCSWKTLLPSFSEQQKIADCLSSLDSVIFLQTQKIDALQQYKKGLMQKLFPAEGETVSELRFGGFKSSPDWNSSTLGELANYTNGKAHENHVTDLGKYVVVNSKFISSEGSIIKKTDNALCISQKNDILMVLSDVPNGKAIAKCYFVASDNKYTVNQRICKITPKRNVLGNFLFFYLNRNSFFLTFDDGVKQTNLRKEDVLSCPVNYPSLQEQQKIADCLSSLDELITNETQKLAVLKTHKTGLMQQIFPAMDEVTA
ncbi:restriction endonuclease subunit S [Morganella morganii]|nr:restriction endonuclease subunit S [Morganella morganii subsp. morganii]